MPSNLLLAHTHTIDIEQYAGDRTVLELRVDHDFGRVYTPVAWCGRIRARYQTNRQPSQHEVSHTLLYALSRVSVTE